MIMNKILRLSIFLALFFTLISCSSTRTKNISELGAASSTMANIYVKRTGGFVLGGTRAIIKVNGNKEGSLYPNDFLKVNSVPGYVTFTVAGDPLSGVFGSVNTNINVKAGQSYYFIIGVGSSKGLGILLGGVIGQAATGGPFTVQQVNQEAYFGYSYDASQDPQSSATTSGSSEILDIEEKLKKLNSMLEQGLITQEQYDTKSSEILNSF